MDRTRTASPGVGTAGAFDARAEGSLPVRVEDRTTSALGSGQGKARWLRIGLRMVRDAAVAVAFMTMVPIALVGFKGEWAWGNGNFGMSIRAKLAFSDHYRPLALPKDPSITPMQAGLAFNAMQSKPEAGAFPAIELASRPAHSWDAVALTPDMFVGGAMSFGFKGPSSSSILERVSKGLTAQETAYLRTLATAPVWREFDLVARAPAVDMIGGALKLPFPENASAEQMPARYKEVKELAYASVSRAAYHLSVGQRDSAEAALRSIISIGFTLIDNGHTALDEMIGAIIIGIGRDALGRFYVVTKDPRATMPELAPQPKSNADNSLTRLPVDEMRRFLIAETKNPNEHLGMRFEAVRLLASSSCTNVKELMFGNSSEVDAALRDARTSLARYPSERALVDLLSVPPQPRMDQVKYDPIQALAVSSATVAGTVLHNPRLANCTRLVTGYYGGPW